MYYNKIQIRSDNNNNIIIVPVESSNLGKEFLSSCSPIKLTNHTSDMISDKTRLWIISLSWEVKMKGFYLLLDSIEVWPVSLSTLYHAFHKPDLCSFPGVIYSIHCNVRWYLSTLSATVRFNWTPGQPLLTVHCLYRTSNHVYTVLVMLINSFWFNVKTEPLLL